MGKKKRYPANLLEALRPIDLPGLELDYENLTADQMQGVDYILSQLTERESIILDCYYKKGMSRKEIADHFYLTEKRVRQLTREALDKIRAAEWFMYAVNGYEDNQKRLEEQCGTEENRFCAARGITDRTHIYYQEIECLNLPVRPYHSMKRAGIRTVRDALLFICSGQNIRGFGELSAESVRAALVKENLLPKGFKKRAAPNIPRLELEADIFRSLNACDRQNKRRSCA